MLEDIEENNMIGPILTLKYNQYEGLCLDWTFHGISKPKNSAHHYFVFQDQPLKNVKQLFDCYYQHINFGDLFGIVKKSTSKIIQNLKIEWFEKFNKKLPDNKINQRNISCDQKQLFRQVDMVLDDSTGKRGMSMINICLNRSRESERDIFKLIEQMADKLKYHRETKNSSGVVVINIIHGRQIENRISLKTSVNLFAQQRSLKSLCESIRNYCYSVKLQKIKTTIEILTPNYFLGNTNNYHWQPKDFVTIQKCCYAIPNINYKQIMIFMMQDLSQVVDVQLLFTLNITFIDGDEMKTEKHYHFKESLSKIYSKTTQMVGYQQFYCVKMGKKQVLLDLASMHNFVILNCPNKKIVPKKKYKEVLKH